jgi:hypothetical protein
MYKEGNCRLIIARLRDDGGKYEEYMEISNKKFTQK